MDVEQARFNMVEQQIRPWDVLDSSVLDLLQAVPREDFVPIDYQNLAFADIEVPIGHGEVMLSPKHVGRLLQAADLHESDLVFEVGTGSGYVTALLAKACRHIDSVDIHVDFIKAAKANLTAQGISNVNLAIKDAAQSCGNDKLYDVIVLTGSVPILPDAFSQSLQRGGRLVAYVGKGPVMDAILITRLGDNEWDHEVLFETEIKALNNAATNDSFSF